MFLVTRLSSQHRLLSLDFTDNLILQSTVARISRMSPTSSTGSKNNSMPPARWTRHSVRVLRALRGRPKELPLQVNLSLNNSNENNQITCTVTVTMDEFDDFLVSKIATASPGEDGVDGLFDSVKLAVLHNLPQSKKKGFERLEDILTETPRLFTKEQIEELAGWDDSEWRKTVIRVELARHRTKLESQATSHIVSNLWAE